jgi:hypothetical protein
MDGQQVAECCWPQQRHIPGEHQQRPRDRRQHFLRHPQGMGGATPLGLDDD